MKTKYCVCRDVREVVTGTNHTGIFSWVGPSWRTATITGLVKKLPATISDKDLRKAYKDFIKGQRA